MNITILGAGVGGLSTAIALKQKGFEVTVYERMDKISDIGAGIVCWPNASFVLDKLGVLDKVAAVAGMPVSMRRINSDGQSLGALDIAQLNAYMQYPSYSILRRDLMAILAKRARELGIDIVFNHNVEAIEEIESNISRIRFDNGVVLNADVVIGADGRMNSIARRFIRGDNTPEYQGFINWIGVFESDTPVFEEIAVSDFWGVGRRFGIVPISRHKAYWAGGVAAKEIGHRNPTMYQEDLINLFQHWPDPIMQIIRETPIDAINKIYVHDHNPSDRWHKGCVLMIGDAAHAPLPTSGQGACQALEDAWHLAQLMENDESEIARVFAEFTRTRFSKTTGITMGARQLASSLFNTDPDYCEQRNLKSLSINYSEMAKGMANAWSSGLPLNA